MKDIKKKGAMHKTIKTLDKSIINSERMKAAFIRIKEKAENAKLLNISGLQLSYITNVEAGRGLIKVGSSLVPFFNNFPKTTKLYSLITTKFSDLNG